MKRFQCRALLGKHYLFQCLSYALALLCSSHISVFAFSDPRPLPTSFKVYYLAQPAPPSLVGLGRNVLASWEHPILPPADASLYFPPRPFWRLHAKRIPTSNASSSSPSASPSRLHKLKNRSKSTTLPPKGGNSPSPTAAADATRTVTTTVVGQGPSWALIGGLEENAAYEITLTCELPVGESCYSIPVTHSTVVPSPAVVEDGDEEGAEGEDEKIPAKDEVRIRSHFGFRFSISK